MVDSLPQSEAAFTAKDTRIQNPFTQLREKITSSMTERSKAAIKTSADKLFSSYGGAYEKGKRAAVKDILKEKDTIEKLSVTQGAEIVQTLYDLPKVEGIQSVREMANTWTYAHLDEIKQALEKPQSNQEDSAAIMLDIVTRLVKRGDPEQKAAAITVAKEVLPYVLSHVASQKDALSVGKAFGVSYGAMTLEERQAVLATFDQQHSLESSSPDFVPGFATGFLLSSLDMEDSAKQEAAQAYAQVIVEKAGLDMSVLKRRWGRAVRRDLVPEFYINNFAAIEKLEQARPGICATLRQDFGISNFTYPMDVLINQYDQREDKTHPFVPVVEVVYNWNEKNTTDAAFDFEPLRNDLKKADQLFRLYEIEDKPELDHFLTQAKEKYANPISSFVLHGHADKNGIALGYPFTESKNLLTVDDLQDGWWDAHIQPTLAPNSTVVLVGCELGKKEGFAQQLSRKGTGMRVIAASEKSNMGKGIRARLKGDNSIGMYVDRNIRQSYLVKEYLNGQLQNTIRNGFDWLFGKDKKQGLITRRKFVQGLAGTAAGAVLVGSGIASLGALAPKELAAQNELSEGDKQRVWTDFMATMDSSFDMTKQPDLLTHLQSLSLKDPRIQFGKNKDGDFLQVELGSTRSALEKNITFSTWNTPTEKTTTLGYRLGQQGTMTLLDFEQRIEDIAAPSLNPRQGGFQWIKDSERTSVRIPQSTPGERIIITGSTQGAGSIVHVHPVS